MSEIIEAKGEARVSLRMPAPEIRQVKVVKRNEQGEVIEEVVLSWQESDDAHD